MNIKNSTLTLLLLTFLGSACKKADPENLNSKENSNPKQEILTDFYRPEIKQGFHRDSIYVVNPDGTAGYRHFNYLWPENTSGKLPLVVNFHGSISNAGTMTQARLAEEVIPSQDIHFEKVLARTNKNIIIWPQGTINAGTCNWTETDKNIAFTDSLVHAFLKSNITDPDRIFAWGQSSGGIFCFSVATRLNNLFASACPVSAQFNTRPDVEGRLVPLRCFNGMTDAIVNYASAKKNFINWAVRIGTYLPGDSIKSLTPIVLTQGKKTLTMKPLHYHGSTDYELMSLLNTGHGIEPYMIYPSMWEFWNSHAKNTTTSTTPLERSMGIEVSTNTQEYEVGHYYSFEIYTTPNVTLTVSCSIPGFAVKIQGKKLLVASGYQKTEGDVIVTGTSTGNTLEEQKVMIHFTPKPVVSVATDTTPAAPETTTPATTPSDPQPLPATTKHKGNS